jgi:riboflavin synthase
MFTGIISDIGRIADISGEEGRRLTIETRLPLAEIAIGSSIATSGICFTMVEKRDRWFTVEASGATLKVTTAGDWLVGEELNLERSLRVGDEMGGHLVFGHVDAVGEIQALEPAGESHRLEVRVPERLAPLIAVKGSIAVDGMSLTVNEVSASSFVANIIPHTLRHTNLGRRGPGERVNVEIDMLARYVARQLAFRAGA